MHYLFFSLLLFPAIGQSASKANQFFEKPTPAENALGMGSNCGDCHGTDFIDWDALGWTKDPMAGGERVSSAPVQSISSSSAE
jgi:hypothetical protein